MPTIELTPQQVKGLIRQLPDEDRNEVLDSLLHDRWAKWRSVAEPDESAVRDIASGRGLDWDSMSDDERNDLIQTICEEA